VAVRSSGISEDSNTASLAWSFRTELNVEPTQIGAAIKRIHKHSLAKANEKIPVVVQEMVPSQNSWVVFTYDVDEGKPYFVVNLWDWLWESLVSGEQTWETYKILSWIDPELIPNKRIRNLYKAVSLIVSKYPTQYIDVEFAFAEGSDIPYILQVRPIVWVKPYSYDERTTKLATRYARLVQHNLQKTWAIYGNMIDINPEELVWGQPELVKSFFDTIFPRTSLVAARRYLWYGWWMPIMELVNHHPYVSLERDIRLFLPGELPEVTEILPN
jgi:phosphoenolpyruvate synthase/pyruvate phosphate dikinase